MPVSSTQNDELKIMFLNASFRGMRNAGIEYARINDDE